MRISLEIFEGTYTFHLKPECDVDRVLLAPLDARDATYDAEVSVEGGGYGYEISYKQFKSGVITLSKRKR